MDLAMRLILQGSILCISFGPLMPIIRTIKEAFLLQSTENVLADHDRGRWNCFSDARLFKMKGHKIE